MPTLVEICDKGKLIGYSYAWEGTRCIGLDWSAYKMDGKLFIIESKNERRSEPVIKVVDY